ncbi:hypothetical protein [Novosphingobium colocasiae]|uniref:hypothetical protein n=1 Tax=Novosphingobium colocasiae TaxID=1256513 RepID=UPI0035B00E3F
MSILAVSDERHQSLKRFRRNAWKAIALCAVVRLADTALGLGFIEPTHTLAAKEIPAGPVAQECNP